MIGSLIGHAFQDFYQKKANLSFAYLGSVYCEQFR